MACSPFAQSVTINLTVGNVYPRGCDGVAELNPAAEIWTSQDRSEPSDGTVQPIVEVFAITRRNSLNHRLHNKRRTVDIVRCPTRGKIESGPRGHTCRRCNDLNPRRGP